MFSLIGRAKRNRIESTAYLNDLFTRLPETSTQDLDQFLTDQWQPPT